MSNNILIIGESGSGKSSSIAKLNPEETFIINVLDKPLPFRGFKNNYTKLNESGGNYYATDDHSAINRIINGVNEKRPEIKNVIIDDFQYIMANEFMRRATERGFDKFTEIALHAWNIIRTTSFQREDLNFFYLSHSETTNEGKSKCKTIGKMIDDKITLEGMFTIILHSLVVDGKYKFLTQYDGVHIAKSPMGMFETKYIDNDLEHVKDKMNQYFNESL